MRIRLFSSFALALFVAVLALSSCTSEKPSAADVDSPSPADAPATTTVDHTEPIDTPPMASTAETDVAAVEGVIAYVNSLPIDRPGLERSKEQVLSRYDQLYRQFGMNVYTFLAGAQGRMFALGIEDEALELSITRTLIRHELDQRGAAVSDEAAEAEFQRQYQQFLAQLGFASDQAFQDAHQAGEIPEYVTGGLSYEGFMAYARRSVREDQELRTLQEEVGGTIEPTDDELRAFFEEWKSEYAQPERVNASHILVDSEELATEIFDELRAGGDFAALAREHSGCPSGAQGGALGWFERGQMVDEFEEAAFATPAGEITDIVATSYGFHIIQVIDYQPARSPAYEDVADEVLADFTQEARMDRFGEWYDSARQTAVIVVVDPMLQAYRTYEEDLEQGLLAFLRVRNESLADDPYLEYVLGTLYEEMIQKATEEMARLSVEDEDPLDAEAEARLTALELEIDTLRQHAVAAYEAAMETLGESPEIQARIDALMQAAAPL